jgi:hypothetical protein
MIAWLKTLNASRELARSNRVKLDKLREAREFRAAMRRALADAESRGDDREIGQFTIWLRRATSDVVGLELSL